MYASSLVGSYAGPRRPSRAAAAAGSRWQKKHRSSPDANTSLRDMRSVGSDLLLEGRKEGGSFLFSRQPSLSNGRPIRAKLVFESIDPAFGSSDVTVRHSENRQFSMAANRPSGGISDTSISPGNRILRLMHFAIGTAQNTTGRRRLRLKPIPKLTVVALNGAARVSKRYPLCRAPNSCPRLLFLRRRGRDGPH